MESCNYGSLARQSSRKSKRANYVDLLFHTSIVLFLSAALVCALHASQDKVPNPDLVAWQAVECAKLPY
eukprot:1682347-Amphidinium_carterae.1